MLSWGVFSVTVHVSLTLSLIYRLNTAPGLASALWCHNFFFFKLHVVKTRFSVLPMNLKRALSCQNLHTQHFCNRLFSVLIVITAWFSKKAKHCCFMASEFLKAGGVNCFSRFYRPPSSLLLNISGQDKEATFLHWLILFQIQSPSECSRGFFPNSS